jgi:D-beta-D-heptose 7-phosphate kinase/D-beta-D-heptose 1-phosphate adenosyltransferase
VFNLNIEQILTRIQSFKDTKVLVIGDIMLDRFIWGNVNRISPEAPIPIVQVNHESEMPGGAANVATNISALKGQAYVCGLVGQDTWGINLIQELNSHNINTSTIIQDPDRTTTVKDRIIAQNQQIVRIDREDTHDISPQQLITLKNILQDILPKMNLVIIEDYGKGLISADLIQHIISLAHKHDVKVAVDPKEKHFDFYKDVSVITPNHHEAEKATGITITDNLSLNACGNKLLHDLNCVAVLLTRGEQGMSLFQQSKAPHHISTIAKEVYDVSGAGDTVIATFSLALASGASLEEAAFLSNIAGGIVVGKLGVGTVTPAELEKTLCKQLV